MDLRAPSSGVIRAVEKNATWAGVGLFQRWLALVACARVQGLFDSALAVWGEARPVGMRGGLAELA